MATSDETPKKPTSAAKKPVTQRPAASKPVRPSVAAAAADAKPVGKQAQAAAFAAEQEAKKAEATSTAPATKPIAPTASPAATVAPAGADTPRAVRVDHTPEAAPKDIAKAAAEAPQAVFSQPIKKRPGPVALVTVGLIIATIAIVLIAAYFMLALGPTLTFIGGLLALIPLAIVLIGIRWIDRWEPEPRSGLIFAFLWGAGVSVVLALVVDIGVSEQIAAGGGATNGTIFAQTVFQAPIVEEFAKGLGVLL
ncbi:MAG: PrsW family glutamic-type intramembrane protease, partial [Pseudolysinimonas sp.]